MDGIRDVDEPDFEVEVLERSRTVPVVVDFWAAWCGPCRALGPVLEAEVRALGGRAELAKVDTEKNPGLAARYGVRGIPAVMAFRDGAVCAEFVGAQGAHFVRDFLEQLAPSEERAALAAADAAARAGDLAAAEAGARAILARDAPAGDVASEAAVLLGGILLQTGRAQEVSAALERVDKRGPLVERADTLRELVALADEARAGGGEAAARERLAASPDDLEARWTVACAMAARTDWDGALDGFLEIVSRSRRFRSDAARLAMLTIFAWLGSDDPRVRAARRRLQIVT
jgi:putative thioredoxin